MSVFAFLNVSSFSIALNPVAHTHTPACSMLLLLVVFFSYIFCVRKSVSDVVFVSFTFLLSLLSMFLGVILSKAPFSGLICNLVVSSRCCCVSSQCWIASVGARADGVLCTTRFC